MKSGDYVNTLYVGVDVSIQNNQVCAMNFDQNIFFKLSFPNTPAGCENLITVVRAFIDKEKFEDIIITAESTSIYDYHVCAYLTNQLSLVNVPVVIYSVNPKSIANYLKNSLFLGPFNFSLKLTEKL